MNVVPMVRLGDKLNFLTSGSRGWAKHYAETGAKFLRIQNVGRNRLLLDDMAYVQAPESAEARRTRVQPGDVLLSITADLGRTGVVPDDIGEAHISQHLAILRLAPDFDPRFVAAFIGLGPGGRQIKKLDKVGVKSGLNFDDVRSLEIPLPPLPEQRRIADILDKADAIRRKRQEAVKLADELLRSAFLEMFGDPVTNPRGWPTSSFGSVGTLDRGKSRHRPRNDPALLGGGHPLIQTGEVANSGGVITSHTQTYSDLGLAQSRKWPAGTLCITIAANIAKTGVLAIDACFPDSVVGFHPGAKVTTEFVQGWLAFLQPLIEARAPQVAQKNINLEILRALDLPVPPIASQQRFAEVVALIRAVGARVTRHGETCDNLFDSLVQRAFRGEL